MGRGVEQKGGAVSIDPRGSRRKVQKGNGGQRSRSTEEVAAQP